MKMKELLREHKRIEQEAKENFEAAASWDRTSLPEVLQMIEEKDRLQEWDEHFAFLVQLLNRKRHHAEFGI